MLPSVDMEECQRCASIVVATLVVVTRTCAGFAPEKNANTVKAILHRKARSAAVYGNACMDACASCARTVQLSTILLSSMNKSVQVVCSLFNLQRVSHGSNCQYETGSALTLNSSLTSLDFRGCCLISEGRVAVGKASLQW